MMTPVVSEIDVAVAPELARVRLTSDVLARVPAEFARRHQLLPLRCDERQLLVAVADPSAVEGIDALGCIVERRVVAVAAAPAAVAAAIERWYGLGATPTMAAPRREENAAPVGAIELGERSPILATVGVAPAAEAPVIRWVHQIILDGIQRQASDIHLEPLARRLRVRYRIDGALVEVENPPKELQLPIVSRLKIMANLSIAEKRVPQDGRIQVGFGGRLWDLRVSSLPTAHGESIVLRILDQEGVRLGLAELGLQPDDAAAFRRLIGLSDGIVLVTGPTGSGKTTTLYSCLHAINQRERKIITVEDPVEYQLNGINQVPVRPDVGMTFASALRTMLRQSPNVIMVGEIRDYETAEIAVHAALTGHLVFSTLHTNDAPGAVTRLIDLGVKPFLVASALRASIAQRLVRKICSRCQRVEANPAAGAGCPNCHGTGYRGRTGIFEIFAIDDPIRRLVHDRAGSAQLREKARSQGMRTLREDGLRKVTAGLTTMEEVVSLTIDDIG